MILALMLLVVVVLVLVVVVATLAELDRADGADRLEHGNAIAFGRLDHVEQALFECGAVGDEDRRLADRGHLLR